MPRQPRIVAPGFPHHITQRGNNREDVFFCKADRELYLELIKEQARRYGLLLEGHCLMTNHVHLIGVPQRMNSLARAVGRTNQLYAQYINDVYGRSGHLWQNRFYSCVMDEDHFWRALHYVESNPCRERMTANAWEYPWSSAAVHVGLRPRTGLLQDRLWAESWTTEQWKQVLSREPAEEELSQLRSRTMTGRPIGSKRFIEQLQQILNRCITMRPRGRPRKQTGESGQTIIG